MNGSELGRRHVLTMGGSLAGTALAGCLEGPDLDDNPDAEPTGTGAFYTLMEWGDAVTGDAMTFDTPVDVGQMGHGWDPDADIVATIAQDRAFIYLETPEFQWSIDVAGELAADHDVALIDGMDAIPQSALLPFTDVGSDVLASPDSEVEIDPADLVIGEFEVVVGNEISAYWHADHWHGGIPDVPLDDTHVLRFNVRDDEDRVLPLNDESPLSITAMVDDDDIVGTERVDDGIELSGESPGQTLLSFAVTVDDETVFRTAEDPLVVTVAEADEVDLDAFYDPHVWVDPIHAKSIVEHIAAELGELLPDEEDDIEQRTEEYVERIDAVDRQFEELVDDAALDVAVYVAHDAFQYVEDRYGFELQTPVGVTPDAAASIEDLAELRITIEEHGIETILFDPFEAADPNDGVPQAVEVLLEDTPVQEAMPLSPVEGITREWHEEGYGWVEQMEEINLPALRKALKAT